MGYEMSCHSAIRLSAESQRSLELDLNVMVAPDEKVKVRPVSGMRGCMNGARALSFPWRK